MKQLYISVKWLALVAAFGALGLGMAFATPVGARQGTGENPATGTINVPETATGAGSLVGIDEEGLLSYNDIALTKAVASGATWSRTEVDWNSIEAVRGVFNFAETDAALNKLLGSGLTPVVYVSYNP